MNISTPVPENNPVDLTPNLGLETQDARRHRGAPEGLSVLAPKRKRGAPAGNSNARIHGYYARKTTDACRLALEAATPYRGIDLDIILALWQAVRLPVVAPDRESLQDDAMQRVFGLIRRKYGLRSRKDHETLFALFLRLVCDLIFQEDLYVKLEKARKLA